MSDAVHFDEGLDPTQPERPDLSLGDVVGKLGSDVSALLTTQLEIAKLELKEEASKAARGAGLLGSGLCAAIVAILMLSSAAAWGIAESLNAWAGFLIVGVAWTVAAAALSSYGKKRLSSVTTAPEQTTREIHADRDLVKRLP